MAEEYLDADGNPLEEDVYVHKNRDDIMQLVFMKQMRRGWYLETQDGYSELRPEQAKNYSLFPVHILYIRELMKKKRRYAEFVLSKLEQLAKSKAEESV